jgi:hypothetical protein
MPKYARRRKSSSRSSKVHKGSRKTKKVIRRKSRKKTSYIIRKSKKKTSNTKIKKKGKIMKGGTIDKATLITNLNGFMEKSLYMFDNSIYIDNNDGDTNYRQAQEYLRQSEKCENSILNTIRSENCISEALDLQNCGKDNEVCEQNACKFTLLTKLFGYLISDNSKLNFSNDLLNIIKNVKFKDKSDIKCVLAIGLGNTKYQYKMWGVPDIIFNFEGNIDDFGWIANDISTKESSGVVNENLFYEELDSIPIYSFHQNFDKCLHISSLENIINIFNLNHNNKLKIICGVDFVFCKDFYDNLSPELKQNIEFITIHGTNLSASSCAEVEEIDSKLQLSEPKEAGSGLIFYNKYNLNV